MLSQWEDDWMKCSVTVVLCVMTLVATMCIPTTTHAQGIVAHKQGVGFTCPVHREVRSPKPGKCPTCGMDLMPAMKADIPGGVTVGKTFRLPGGKTATVREATVLPLVNNWCSERYAFDCHGDKMLATLRQQEKLDEVVAKGKSEFEKQVLLMDWTFRRFRRFGSPTKKGVEGKPLEILAAIDEGHAYNCMYYATVLRAALKSCGYVARSIGLKGAKSDGNGSGHAIVEVWSNQYRKWVVLDPTLNIYFTRAGVPLNAYEIRQEWFYNKGKDFQIRIGAEPEVRTVADMPISRGTHKGFGTLKLKPESIGKFLFVSYTPIKADGRPDYGKMFITKDKLCEGVKYHTRRNPEKPAEEPYFPVQQAAIWTLPWQGSKVKVWATTLTPDFKTFRHRIDGKAWADGAPKEWTLHDGENLLEVISVNKFGIQGAPSKVVIDVAAPKASKAMTVGGRKVTVVERDVTPVVRNQYTKRFAFDAYDNPKLRTLREQEQLEKVVAEGKDEFDRQVILMDWVHRRFKKFGKPTANPAGALEIFKAVDEGHTFFCSHYGRSLVSCAASLGWTNRSMGVRVGKSPHGSGAPEHTTTEIWSNQYGKWVLFDPTYAMYVEKDGVPLSGWEVRQEWFYGDPMTLDFVIGKERKKYKKSDMPIFRSRHAGYGDLSLKPRSIDKLAFMFFIPNTNLMDAGLDYGTGFIVKDDAQCEGIKWHNRDNPKDPAAEVYFPLGCVDIRTEPVAGGTLALEVTLDTMTPNFAGYHFRLDGKKWAAGEPGTWQLHKGANTLEVKTANKFGVEGSPSKIVLEVK
jgi:heavy metal-binding protein/transglutaminase superfamily protein